MQQPTPDIDNLLSGFTKDCNNKVFKNKGSVSWLKARYEQLAAERTKVMFTGADMLRAEEDLSNIITQLGTLLSANSKVKDLEWNFYHYADLFKFKAEKLAGDILGAKEKPVHDLPSITSVRSKALHDLFKPGTGAKIQPPVK